VVPVDEKRGKQKRKRERTIRLTTNEKRLLKDVLRYVSSCVTERYSRLGFSPRLGTAAQNSLFRRRLLSHRFVAVPHGRIKTLWLTKQGREALGCVDHASKRHGGPEHRYWKAKLAARLRRLGYKVREEHAIGGGKAIDLLATKNGRRIAFEIETGKSDVSANVRKALQYGVDRVVVVTTSATTSEKLTAQAWKGGRAEVLTGVETLRRSGW